MSAQDKISEQMEHLSGAAAALDNVRGFVRALEADPLIDRVNPVLLSVAQEATLGLEAAERAMAHLERLMHSVPQEAA